MKKEISIEKPSYLKEAWPGKYQMFSWLEYVVNIPYPIFIITTIKENGKSNACLHSWGFFAGDDKGYYSVLAILKSYHTYENIIRSEEWCINFPSLDQEEKCANTIEHNDIENDEIIDSGFTAESSRRIEAPRIGECSINMECKLEWQTPLFQGGNWHVFTGKVIHIAMDDELFELDPRKRVEKLNIMYNLRSTLNPLTGETGPAGSPVIKMP